MRKSSEYITPIVSLGKMFYSLKEEKKNVNSRNLPIMHINMNKSRERVFFIMARVNRRSTFKMEKP